MGSNYNMTTYILLQTWTLLKFINEHLLIRGNTKNVIIARYEIWNI